MGRSLPQLGRGAARRLARLRQQVHTPADAWVLLRMIGWRLALPLLKFALPLPKLARLMWTPSRRAESQRDREEQIASLAHGLYGPSGVKALDNCLERSLVTYRFLSEAGASPELVVGVSKTGETVNGHVWVTLDGQPVGESAPSLEEFAPVMTFGVAGAVRRLP